MENMKGGMILFIAHLSYNLYNISWNLATAAFASSNIKSFSSSHVGHLRVSV